MKNLSIVTLMVLACMAFKTNEKIVLEDFKPVYGTWTGSLTYLDYKTGKPYTMPANVTVTKHATNNDQLVLAYAYPNEPKANGNDTLTIADNGMTLNNRKLITKRKLPDNAVEIITEENGKDGNDHKAAIIKMTYTMGKSRFSMRKDVQFEGDTAWIERDIYSFKR